MGEALQKDADRIKNLESIINAVLKEKVVIGPNGTAIKLTPSELYELTKSEEILQRMRRRSVGLMKE